MPIISSISLMNRRRRNSDENTKIAYFLLSKNYLFASTFSMFTHVPRKEALICGAVDRYRFQRRE